MKLRSQKILLSASCLLWLALVLSLWAFRFDISHALSHDLGAGAPLSPPTAVFSLPVLGGDAAGGSGKPQFFVVWAFLIGGPIGALFWVVKAESAEAMSLRWRVWTALYLPLTLLIVSWVVLGLWLPFLSL